MADDFDPECDPNNPRILTFSEVKDAAERIEGGIIHTPLCEAKLSKYMDYDIYLKCENLQYTGCASERGLRNALMIACDKSKDKGCIIPSNGNYAQAAAYHGGVLGIPVTVVLPETAPMMKIQRCKDLNATVVLNGQNYEEARQFALKSAQGSTYINCSDNVDVLAGLATVGLEIISQLPEADAVIVPVGGGGLLAGILVACKKLKCSCLVYGAECSKVPTMMKTLQAGKRVEVPIVPSLADSLSCTIAGVNSLATIKGRLDRMLVVDEVWISRAMISMLEREKLVVEGAGACSVAAVMQGLVPELRGKRVVCVLSGGNVDTGTLARIIHRGLAASFRLIKFTVVLSDNPGAMAELMQIIACEGATVKSVITEQMWIKRDVFTISNKLIVETTGEEQQEALKSKLRQRYPEVFFTNVY